MSLVTLPAAHPEPAGPRVLPSGGRAAGICRFGKHAAARREPQSPVLEAISNYSYSLCVNSCISNAKRSTLGT